MIPTKHSTALDQELHRFLDKDYRDSYLQTHVRSGIAYQIHALRAKAQMTQVEFANATGKKQSTISRLEDTEYGRVSVQTLLDIATARGVALIVRFVDYAQFLTITSDMSPKALGPDDIYQSVAKAAASLTSSIFRQLPSREEQPSRREGLLHIRSSGIFNFQERAQGAGYPSGVPQWN